MADFNEYGSQPDVGPNAGWKPHETLEESKELLDRFCKSPGKSAIVYKENTKVIGGMGITYGKNGEAIIGYVMNHDYWGRGLMTEAVKAVMEYLFTSNAAKKVVIKHFTHNVRSRRVVEKCQLKCVAVNPNGYTLYDGTPMDELVWEITREEWENRK